MSNHIKIEPNCNQLEHFPNVLRLTFLYHTTLMLDKNIFSNYLNLNSQLRSGFF